MEIFIQCSKILYDRDIIDKNKQIEILKSRIKELEKNNGDPVIVFHSIKQFRAWVNIFDRDIIDIVDKSLTDIEYVKENGLSFDQCYKIMDTIYNNLYYITGNEKWSMAKSNELINKVNISIQSLISCGLWDKIYTVTDTEISSIIYNLLMAEIGHYDNNYYGVIADITFFKCSKCKNICKCDMLNFISIDCNNCNIEQS